MMDYRSRLRTCVALVIPAVVLVVVVAGLPATAAAVGVKIDGSSAWSERPHISGTRVVWTQHVLGSWPKVYYRNLAGGSPVPLTDGAMEPEVARIWGTRVVFDQASVAMGWAGVSLLDIATMRDQLVSGSIWGGVPDVCGKWVVYRGFVAGGSVVNQIYLKNTDQAGTLMAGGNRNCGEPRVGTRYVVWHDNRYTGDQDVFYIDLRNTAYQHQLTKSNGNELQPATSGNYVVWSDDRSGNSDIWFCDISQAGQPQRALVTNSSYQMDPAISGATVVWTDYRSGNGDIYVHDLRTGGTKRLTVESAKQCKPAISGYRVVWEDYRHGATPRAYYTTLSAPRMTLSAPSRIRYGARALLRARALSVHGIPVKYRYVAFQRSYNRSTWRTYRSVKTLSSGGANCYTPRTVRKTYWRVRYVGSGLSLTSPRRLITPVR